MKVRINKKKKEGSSWQLQVLLTIVLNSWSHQEKVVSLHTQQILSNINIHLLLWHILQDKI